MTTEKQYTTTTYTKPEDMYKCYPLAKLLNEKMTEPDYRSAINQITQLSDYVQHVVLYQGRPVSMAATQTTLMMLLAPKMYCKIDNLATLPEHRGFVTKMLMDNVVQEYREKGSYGGIGLCAEKGNERANAFYERKIGMKPSSIGWRKYFDEREEDKARGLI